MNYYEMNYHECPEFDMTCPYCLASGECIIDNPMDECDTYYYFNSDEDGEMED